MTLVFQYSSQSLLFNETNDKLLGRFLDLLLKLLKSLISCIPESREVSCWGCNANSTRPNTANVHFHFPLRNLQPQTCGLIYKFLEAMHGHWKCWQRLDGLRISTRNMSVNQLNIRGVCRCHASISCFLTQKNL